MVNPIEEQNNNQEQEQIKAMQGVLLDVEQKSKFSWFKDFNNFDSSLSAWKRWE